MYKICALDACLCNSYISIILISLYNISQCNLRDINIYEIGGHALCQGLQHIAACRENMLRWRLCYPESIEQGGKTLKRDRGLYKYLVGTRCPWHVGGLNSRLVASRPTNARTRPSGPSLRDIDGPLSCYSMIKRPVMQLSDGAVSLYLKRFKWCKPSFSFWYLR